MFNNDSINGEQIAEIELGSPIARIRARGKFRDKDALDFVPTPESMLLYIDTPNYDGPLDLLLHLIRKHSMDIFDIPIVTITKKYLEALDEMQALNLDIAGEFLVMAATLAEIKSKMLLPKDEQTSNPEEDEAGEDPRKELIRRLLEYKAFKDASVLLMQRPLLGQDQFFRQIDEQNNQPEAIEQDIALRDLAPVELFSLVENLNKVLKKSESQIVHTITRDRISVSARMHELLDFCLTRSKFTFYDALRFFPIYEKIDVVITFLALLEMSRLRLLRIQNSPRDDLLLTIVKENFYTKHKEILDNIDKTKDHISYDG